MAVRGDKAVWLTGIYHWLAQVDGQQKSDVIFVLAGRESRKYFGLRLLKEGWGDRLLLSVGRFEIRKFCDLPLPVSLDLSAIAGKAAPEERHYFVDVERGKAECHRIDIGHCGTWSEILAFSNWLQKNQAIRSATIVSSGFHIRRIRICCRCLVRDSAKLTFLGVPEEDAYFRDGWWQNPKSKQLMLKELAKLPAYKVLGSMRSMNVFLNDGSPKCGIQKAGRQLGREVASPSATIGCKTTRNEIWRRP